MKANLTFILKYADQKRFFLLGYLALVLECLTPIIAVLLQREMIDDVFIAGNYHLFPWLLGLYALFYFGPKLWFTVRKVSFFTLSYDIQKRMTRAFIEKIYRTKTSTISKKHSAKLLNTMRNDIRDVCNISINQLLSESVKVLLTVILLAVTLAFINVTMLLLVIGVALVYYGLLQLFGEKTKAYARAVRVEKAKVSMTIEESISAIREILAFNRQSWQLERYDKSFSCYYKAVMRESLYKVKVVILSDPFFYGTKLMVILFGGIAAMQSSMSLGEFVVSFTLVDQLVTALGQLFQQALIAKRLGAATHSVEVLLKEEDEDFGNRDVGNTLESLSFENVSFSYSDDARMVLNNLTVTFPVGKKIALVGESGSGKSTIAQLLLRIHKVESGSVTINGIAVDEYNERYKDMVSAVFQEPHFIPSSIEENLSFNNDYTKKEIEEMCKAMHCHDFIQSYPQKYQTHVGERGANLSGGQKQRLALSRSLLKNTDLLILDEATSALDTETEYKVQANIDRLRKGKTTIVIAHRLSTIQNADLIYVLDHGKIVAKGSHDDLIMASETYQQLYQSSSIAKS